MGWETIQTQKQIHSPFFHLHVQTLGQIVLKALEMARRVAKTNSISCILLPILPVFNFQFSTEWSGQPPCLSPFSSFDFHFSALIPYSWSTWELPTITSQPPALIKTHSLSLSLFRSHLLPTPISCSTGLNHCESFQPVSLELWKKNVYDNLLCITKSKISRSLCSCKGLYLSCTILPA